MSREGELKRNFSGLLESMIGKMDDGVGFVCLVCQKVVLHKGNLKKHIASMHIGESPQECTLCGKSFKNLNSLQNHTSIHHRGLLPVHSFSTWTKQYHLYFLCNSQWKRKIKAFTQTVLSSFVLLCFIPTLLLVLPTSDFDLINPFCSQNYLLPWTVRYFPWWRERLTSSGDASSVGRPPPASRTWLGTSRRSTCKATPASTVNSVGRRSRPGMLCDNTER